MAYEIHCKGAKYQVWSTVSSGYITKVLDYKDLKYFWLNYCALHAWTKCKCHTDIELMRHLKDHLSSNGEYEDNFKVEPRIKVKITKRRIDA